MKWLLIGLLLNVTTLAYAGDKGNGGDPADIMEQIRNKPSQLSEREREAARSSMNQAEIESKRRQEEADVKWSVQQLVRGVLNSYELLTQLNYPFNFPGEAPSTELISETLKHVAYEALIVKEEVYVDGEPVMFKSYPDEQKMEVSIKRLIDTSTRIKIPSTGMDRYMDYTAKEKTTLVAARLATLFHEALVLNRIEDSRDYRFSNQFALGLMTIMTDKDFKAWMYHSLASQGLSIEAVYNNIQTLGQVSISYGIPSLSSKKYGYVFRVFNMPKSFWNLPY